MKYYEINPRGHVWKRTPNGEIDDMALDVPKHNGPQCILCGYSFCEWCTDFKAEEDCAKPAIEAEFTEVRAFKQIEGPTEHTA